VAEADDVQAYADVMKVCPLYVYTYLSSFSFHAYTGLP